MTNYDAVQNFFEPLVYERIGSMMARRSEALDDDFLEDVACVALNRLPSRYVRFRVDAAFYMTTEERNAIDRQVDEAVADAFAFVASNRRDRELSEAG
ncbi:late competence development ComFB family protein [Endothiovibrio diazotrophicus]